MLNVYPTVAELEIDIRELISQATGFTTNRILQGNQSAPSDLDTYFVLQYLYDNPVGLASIGYEEIAGNENEKLCKLRGTRIYGYRLTCLRGDRRTIIPLDYIKSFLMYIETFRAKQFFNFSNFLIFNKNQINLADSVESNEFELRSVLEMELMVSETSQLNVSIIDQINLIGQIDYGTLIEEINTTI